MMTEGWPILASIAIGCGLGGFYFGGLWLTVQHLGRSRHPVALLLGSFAARTALIALVVLALWAVPWGNLAACLAGMVVARLAVGRLVVNS